MRALLVLSSLAVLAGCAGEPPRAPEQAAAPVVAAPPPEPAVAPAPLASNPLGPRIAALAAHYVGRPYRFGGESPKGFDCSGLVHYVYRRVGLEVPRTAAEQRAAAQRVNAEALEPGDLVFFYTPENHVGIYVGHGEFVHAPAAGRRVERTRLDSPYFILGFAGGGRFLGS
jgi:cell wall-associated NlpC family hydrolase